MSELAALTRQFVASVSENRVELYNEFSLQHEFGLFLRTKLPGYAVQFERNVAHFAPSKRGFTKRELDIAVFARDKTEMKYAIELKCPRYGQHPDRAAHLRG